MINYTNLFYPDFVLVNVTHSNLTIKKPNLIHLNENFLKMELHLDYYIIETIMYIHNWDYLNRVWYNHLYMPFHLYVDDDKERTNQ